MIGEIITVFLIVFVLMGSAAMLAEKVSDYRRRKEER